MAFCGITRCGQCDAGENVTEWTAERTRQIDYWITAADTRRKYWKTTLPSPAVYP